MDIEKLIHCLQCCARVDAHNIGCDDCGLEYCGPECQQLCGTAATALSTLQAENERLKSLLGESGQDLWSKENQRADRLEDENEKLRAELERVKREKDKLERFLGELEGAIYTGQYFHLRPMIEKWRGQKED